MINIVSSDDEDVVPVDDENKHINLNIDDSDEDEEAIIERRRKERQALLAKLSRKDSKFEKISAAADIEDTRENEDDEVMEPELEPEPEKTPGIITDFFSSEHM